MTKCVKQLCEILYHPVPRVVNYCNIKVLQYLLQYFFSIANGISILFLAQYCTWNCNTFISQVLQYFRAILFSGDLGHSQMLCIIFNCYRE